MSRSSQRPFRFFSSEEVPCIGSNDMVAYRSRCFSDAERFVHDRTWAHHGAEDTTKYHGVQRGSLQLSARSKEHSHEQYCNKISQLRLEACPEISKFWKAFGGDLYAVLLKKCFDIVA